MSCLEGLMSGCYLLTTDADALPELWPKFIQTSVVPLGARDFRAELAEHLTDVLRKEPQRDGRSVDAGLQKYYWSSVAKRWEEELEACMAKK